MASACCQVAIHGSLFLGKKELKILHTVNKQAVSFVSDFVHIRPQKIKVFFLNQRTPQQATGYEFLIKRIPLYQNILTRTNEVCVVLKRYCSQG